MCSQVAFIDDKSVASWFSLGSLSGQCSFALALSRCSFMRCTLHYPRSVLSPVGLAVVVLGRDTQVPFPDGCALPPDPPLGSGAAAADPAAGAEAAGSSKNSSTARDRSRHLDPFTHRPFFVALDGVACATFVPTSDGAFRPQACALRADHGAAAAAAAAAARSTQSGAGGGTSVGSRIVVDAVAVAQALLEAVGQPACARRNCT